jgi:hypothetical protein
VIDSRFVFVAIALSIWGSWSYIRDTLRGTTTPHRVTWGLWGLGGLLAFAVELEQGVGLSSVMTLSLGLVPCLVFLASLKNPAASWRIDAVDLACGVISLVGIAIWASVHQATLALVSFTVADAVAGLPTFRKSWKNPASETPRAFALGAINTFITILTLRHLTTAGALFPGMICVSDTILTVVLVLRVGPRWRGELRGAS